MTSIPLKPENERFTDEQWQAIFDQGDNLLVSVPLAQVRRLC